MSNNLLTIFLLLVGFTIIVFFVYNPSILTNILAPTPDILTPPYIPATTKPPSTPPSTSPSTPPQPPTQPPSTPTQPPSTTKTYTSPNYTAPTSNTNKLK